MFAVKTMTPSQASKQATAAASKIKNKILNTSSFFKVSLKTNNKALALALEAQKERSRQLEREVVYLQKQVEALCFELATRKYKDRKLLLILKNLHSNTLQHFDMVADIFSDSDLPKLSQDKKSLFGNINEDNLAVESLTDQLPPRPEMSRDLLCPSKNAAAAAAAADLPEKNLEEKVVCVQTRATKSTDAHKGNTDAEKSYSSQHIPAPQTGASRPSSSLRDEVERLSMMFSQPAFDVKSAPRPQNSRTSSVLGSCEKSSPASADDVVPHRGSAVDTEPDPGNKQEKTVLMNTTMEMTQSDAAEIVTVETKAKKTGRPNKPKGTKRKEDARGSSSAKNPQVKKRADSGTSEVRTDPTDALLQADDHEPEGVRDPDIKCPSPRKQSNNVISSRIPKLTKSEAGNCQKKAKSSHHTKSKTESCDSVLPDLDDYFMDPENKVGEGVKLPPERDAAEEAVSRITCRRSRTKGRRVSSLTRKTSFTLPLPPHESMKLKPLHDEAEEVDQEPNEDVLFSADEITHPESDHAGHLLSKLQSKMKKTTASSEPSHESRCRKTFVVSVVKDGSSSTSASPEVAAVEQDLVPSAGPFICEAGLTGAGGVRQRSESNPQTVEQTPSSCKRPWVATQDSGGSREDLGSNESHDVLLLRHDSAAGAEFQKPKKARREESGKKKARQRKEGEELSKDKTKKKKRSCGNKGSRSEDEACFLQGAGDASALCGTDDPEGNKQQPDGLRVSDISEEDDFLQHFHDSKLTQSKSRMDVKQNRRRAKSKLHAPTGSRNPRETFVVSRRKTQDRVSLNSTWASDASGLEDAGAHRSLGDLLTDEMPPWLADVSAAHAELGSLLATPRREASGGAALTEESAAVTTDASPAGRVLTSLTNTITTPDSERCGRTRRRNGVVSYKEPPLNSKIRRGDKFTDSMFLSSPVFKDGKKKKQKKTKQKLEGSILLD